MLLTLVDDPDSGVRRELTMTLGRIGDQAAIDGLMELLNHSDSNVRWRAVLGLTRNNVKTALPLLRKRLLTENNKIAREHLEKGIKKLSGQ